MQHAFPGRRRTLGSALLAVLISSISLACIQVSPSNGQPSAAATTALLGGPSAIATVGTVATPADVPPAPLATGAGSPTGLCTLFTTDEISAVLGQPVSAGEVSRFETVNDCQWSGTQADDTFVQIQTVPADGFVAETLAEGWHEVSGPGEQASVWPSVFTGLSLGFVSGDLGYYVSVAPTGGAQAVGEQALIDFGQEFLNRTQP